MQFRDRFIYLFRLLLPTPFTIAVVLTVFTFLLAFILTDNPKADESHLIFLAQSWENGLWQPPLLVFALQMMLMLVLGHVLALTAPVSGLINYVVRYCNNTANAAFMVCFLTIVVGLFNWGLGLIFGAIIARKVGENAATKNVVLNYPLIGACGYVGLLVWHGGLSGSAPIKVAEQEHFLQDLTGVISQSQTIFSSMNLAVSGMLLLVLPITMYLMGKKSTKGSDLSSIRTGNKIELEVSPNQHAGAEKLDFSSLFSILIGSAILSLIIYNTFILPSELSLSVITPNYINLMLLATALLMHKNVACFLKAVDQAISGASGILIQFPLYFGIMGIMKESGLVTYFSEFFVQISTETTFPIYTFFSAGLVNIFVPSGGGQWAVQGPIIAEAAAKLNVAMPKCIMALAYGDQLTNMLQPFWALPLLGITGLKARDILPYTLVLMVVASCIFIGGLLIFS